MISPATVRVTVTAPALTPNVAPSFTTGAALTDSPGARTCTIPAWATDISAGPASEAGRALTFTVTNDDTTLFSVQPSIAPDGTLSYTPAASGTGSATLTVMLSDDGGTANGGVDTSAEQTATVTLTFTAYVASASLVSLIDVEAGAVVATIPVDRFARSVAIARVVRPE